MRLNHFLCIFDFLFYPCYSYGLEKSLEKSLKNKKISQIFSSNFFCSYECKSKQKYWKRKINHLKVFIFIFYLQSISSLSFFLTKIEIRLRYRAISTMMFLSIKKSLLYPQNNYGKTKVRDIGFCWDFNRLLVKHSIDQKYSKQVKNKKLFIKNFQFVVLKYLFVLVTASWPPYHSM